MAATSVVRHHSDRHGFRHAAIEVHNPGRVFGEVIRHGHKHIVRAATFGVRGQVDGDPGSGLTRTDSHRYASIDVPNHVFDESAPLVLRERKELARTAQKDDPVDSPVDNVVRQALGAGEIQIAVLSHGCGAAGPVCLQLCFSCVPLNLSLMPLRIPEIEETLSRRCSADGLLIQFDSQPRPFGQFEIAVLYFRHTSNNLFQPGG